MVDLISVFSDPQAWVELATLTFLEMVLGIDNLVFLVITTDRLPKNRQRLGRRLGLCGALLMRILLLCSVSWLMSLENPLFSIPFLPGEMGEITARELIMLAGGIYLVYKGAIELISKIRLHDEDESSLEGGNRRQIGLFRGVCLIMVMDVVFSLDSVITATGLVNDLPIMILAVMVAVAIMIIFADVISNFINKHSGIKILALTFIVMVGVLLVCESLSVHLDKTTVYYAMAFALVVQVVEINWGKRGIVVSMVALTIVSIVLNVAMPMVFGPSMCILGLVVSGLVVWLLSMYTRNLEKMRKSTAEGAK